MRFRVVAVLTVVAVAVGGCGGSSTTSGASTSGSAASSGVPSSGGAATSSASAAAPSSSAQAVPSAPAGSSAVVPPSAAPSAPVVVPPPAANTGKDKGVLFLEALTGAGVPTSTTGAAELQLAQGVCSSLASGTPRVKVVDDIALRGGLMTDEQVDALVTAAETIYC
ncbi:DUF732 domain-containing protein [Umezawaea endophytica]|uniref:DUF732 domain-containing protein n=1 Tax=Umezawaea endophytica TaxID=1654476 RepID=A0A9X2VT03_9PSEU|nr:DUF732 domain-containing protein [Umezawaea endophytica]MCS7481028.1 DUF732 domain-containing protein [Umezawaea endophytica]